MVYNSKEDVVYGISRYEDDVFFAIDCSSNRVISRLDLPRCSDLAYDSLDNKAYCTFSFNSESLLVVDGRTHARIRALGLPSEAGGGFTAWSSVLNRLYVTCDDHDVLVLDCAADTVMATVRVGLGPKRPVVNERHRKLYVLNYQSETVSIVDMETNEVIRTIRLDNVPQAGSYSYAGDKFYLGCPPEVLVIDGVGDTLVAQVGLPVGTSVQATVADDRTGLVAVAGGGYLGETRDTVFVVDVHTDSVVSAVPVGRQTTGLLWSATRRHLYCLEGTSDSVWILAGDGRSVLASVGVGYYPSALAESPAVGRLYVGHSGTQYVYVLRDTITGVAEPERREAVLVPRQSVLAGGSYLLPGAEGLSLVDACGRGVGVLEPGPNVLADLSPGVYLGLLPSGEVRLRLVKLR
jgi:YVTN family beta-propeller protein